MYKAVIKFWFDQISPKQWWAKDSEFDGMVGARFGVLHEMAMRCELYPWRSVPLGRLAEVIVLDQFSRNIYRGQASAFAGDALALALAQEAVAAGADQQLSIDQRNFLYMPFMHSESPRIQQRAEELYLANGDAGSLEFARRHRRIIDRYGRYPHRNKVLRRASTEAELAFLRTPGSSF